MDHKLSSICCEPLAIANWHSLASTHPTAIRMPLRSLAKFFHGQNSFSSAIFLRHSGTCVKKGRSNLMFFFCVYVLQISRYHPSSRQFLRLQESSGSSSANSCRKFRNVESIFQTVQHHILRCPRNNYSSNMFPSIFQKKHQIQPTLSVSLMVFCPPVEAKRLADHRLQQPPQGALIAAVDGGGHGVDASE